MTIACSALTLNSSKLTSYRLTSTGLCNGGGSLSDGSNSNPDFTVSRTVQAEAFDGGGAMNRYLFCRDFWPAVAGDGHGPSVDHRLCNGIPNRGAGADGQYYTGLQFLQCVDAGDYQ